MPDWEKVCPIAATNWTVAPTKFQRFRDQCWLPTLAPLILFLQLDDPNGWSPHVCCWFVAFVALVANVPDIPQGPDIQQETDIQEEDQLEVVAEVLLHFFAADFLPQRLGTAEVPPGSSVR